MTTPLRAATPRTLAEAYAGLVAERASELVGGDTRITKRRAVQDEFVADAFERTNKPRPPVADVVAAARQAMLADAERAVGSGGRISAANVTQLSPLMLRAFEALKAGPADTASIARSLEAAAEGLFHLSDSDDVYEAFHVELSPGKTLNKKLLRELLDWDTEPGEDVTDFDRYPHKSELELHAMDDQFTDVAGLPPEEVSKSQAVDKLMKKHFQSTTLQSETGSVSAQIWMVTPREEDAVRGPLYLFGRLSNGDLVGLKTWRTWS
jgi:hypothetical protein